MVVQIQAGILLTGRTDGDVTVRAVTWQLNRHRLGMRWTNPRPPRGSTGLANMSNTKSMASTVFDPVTSPA